MLKSMFASTAVLAGAALIASAAGIQAAHAAMKLSQAECDTLWNQANPSGGTTLSMAQAQPYVSDFKSIDTDNDGSISQVEFRKGCNKGLVKSSSSSGSSSGTSGSSSTSKSNKY
jgi:hypothetical protein